MKKSVGMALDRINRIYGIYGIEGWGGCFDAKFAKSYAKNAKALRGDFNHGFTRIGTDRGLYHAEARRAQRGFCRVEL